MPLDVLEFGARDLQQLCRPAPTPIGTMTSERWATLSVQMTDAGSLEPDSVRIETAYSLQFLEPGQ